MGHSISSSVVKLRNEFIKKHKARSFICEVIPLAYSPKLSIKDFELSCLNNFAKCNPIYYDSSDLFIFNIPCRAYDADINSYWLSSKKYDTSYQPFYPTWMLSAYALSLETKRLGFKEIVDVGSGDGRIAYCGKVLGIRSIGIEIDSQLVSLQHTISDKTKVKYDILNGDATTLEYNLLELSKPMFFISGLPELGEMLATTVLARVKEISELKHSAGFNFMGSHIMKHYSRDKTGWGWGKIIEDFDLDIIGCLTLPTHWTNDEQVGTAYVYTTCK